MTFTNNLWYNKFCIFYYLHKHIHLFVLIFYHIHLLVSSIF
nr:MAG TPA: Protein of unknown function (DUF1386) [Caudoviricetes sp.]